MPLVPERRADKNGKVSTRWVRTDKATGVAARSTPAPKASGSSTEERLAVRRANKIKRIAKEIVNDKYFSDKEEAQILIDECLNPLSDQTIDIIVATLKEGREYANYVDYVLRDYREPRLTELLSYIKTFHLDTDTSERDTLLSQIHTHKRFSGIADLSTLSGDDREAAEAVIKVSCEVLVEQDINDIGDDLRDTVIANKDSAEDIARFILERKTLDASLVEDYLHGTAPAPLRDGTL